MVHDRQIEKVDLYRESNLMWNNGCTKDDLTPSLLAEGRRRTPAQRFVSHKRVHSQVLRHLRVLRRRGLICVGGFAEQTPVESAVGGVCCYEVD